jgi:hypothetical protein
VDGKNERRDALEVGRRLVVADAVSGEEAAVREVRLEETYEYADEQILHEGGPKFDSGERDSGGPLHAVDQAVVLALCLDVSNSNPAVSARGARASPVIA